MSILTAENFIQPEFDDPTSPYFNVPTGTFPYFVGQPKGSVPLACPLAAVFYDRLILAGDVESPQVWFASRQGNYRDWLFRLADPLDTAQATAGATSTAGIISDPLTAIAAHGNDYLVLATLSQTWVLRGDPFLGAMDNLSRKVGMISARAWTYGPNGELIFLSRDGLYGIAPGAASFPESLSRERLPNELLEVDSLSYDVVLEFSIRRRGVFIWLTPKAGSQDTLNFFYDWELKAFFVNKYVSDHEPFSTIEYEADSALERDVLVGGRDGFIRKFGGTVSHEDDGTAFDSYIAIGPYEMGTDGFHIGMLTHMGIVLGEGSGSVSWTLYTGDTSEKTFENYQADFSVASGSIGRGASNRIRPRVRGESFILKLGVTAADAAEGAWAIEKITAMVRDAGIRRV